MNERIIREVQKRKIEEADKEKKFCVYLVASHALHWIKGCDELPIHERPDFCPRCGKPTKPKAFKDAEEELQDDPYCSFCQGLVKVANRLRGQIRGLKLLYHNGTDYEKDHAFGLKSEASKEK